MLSRTFTNEGAGLTESGQVGKHFYALLDNWHKQTVKQSPGLVGELTERPIKSFVFLSLLIHFVMA